jgi:hypothetical protein
MATHEDFSRTHDVKSSSHRSFGWVFTIVFAIIGVWPALFGGAVRWWCLIVSAAFLAVTLAAPALLGPLNKLWLRLGLLLNRVVNPLVLGIMFYLVVTPMAWIMRVAGKDSMRARTGRGDSSYWIKRDPPGPKPDSLNNQF